MEKGRANFGSKIREEKETIISAKIRNDAGEGKETNDRANHLSSNNRTVIIQNDWQVYSTTQNDKHMFHFILEQGFLNVSARFIQIFK